MRNRRSGRTGYRRDVKMTYSGYKRCMTARSMTAHSSRSVSLSERVTVKRVAFLSRYCWFRFGGKILSRRNAAERNAAAAARERDIATRCSAFPRCCYYSARDLRLRLGDTAHFSAFRVAVHDAFPYRGQTSAPFLRLRMLNDAVEDETREARIIAKGWPRLLGLIRLRETLKQQEN